MNDTPNGPDWATLDAEHEADRRRQMSRLQERDIIANAVLRPLTLKAIGYAVERAPHIPWPCSGDDLARAKMLAKLDALPIPIESTLALLAEPHRTALTDMNNRRVWL